LVKRQALFRDDVWDFGVAVLSVLFLGKLNGASTMRGVKYSFEATLWRSNPPGGWFFLALPADFSAEIRASFGSEEEGWGRLKATARIGQSEWKTAIWFDTKRSTYLLPVKADVRTKEALSEGYECTVAVWI